MPWFSSTYQPERRGNQKAAGDASKKAKIIRAALILALHKPAPGQFDATGKPRKYKDVIADKLIELARQGDMTAIRLIFDRIDGRQATRHQGEKAPAFAVSIQNF